jgi:O-antigen ligase
VAVKSQRQTFFAENLVAHNVFIGILVEQGIVGITLFVTLLGACAVTILRLPPQYRTLWAVLALSWLTQAQAGSLERGKITWLLFALLAAHHAVGSKCGAALPMYAGTETNAPRRRPSWAASAGVAPPLARR